MGDIDEFFVTFGVQYTKDPERGETHPLGMHKDGYAVIEAPDMKIAQAMAKAIFDNKYAFIYDREDFILGGTKDRWYSHPDAELLRIKWIVPEPQTKQDDPFRAVVMP